MQKKKVVTKRIPKAKGTAVEKKVQTAEGWNRNVNEEIKAKAAKK